MSSTFEKSVKGATKVKLAPPKSKYIEHILQATHTGENGVGEVFRSLQFRLRDSTWTIAFKALIVVHLMIRDGEPNVTLKYLSQQSPQKILAVNTYTDVQTQGRNIRNYSRYLVERARAYAKTRWDYVGASSGRLKKLPVEKGLLRETESVQDQIQVCLRCGDFFTDESENEISLTAFRALTMDLLALFSAMNEGTIAILERYFEMSKPDAERALEIYKRFASQTDKVDRFLSLARHYQQATRLEVPKIKHAPTNLISSLEEYLHDKDFEINRRQYLAQQEGVKNRIGGGQVSNTSFGKTGANPSSSRTDFPESKPTFSSLSTQQAKGPAPDLIDFFGSIEQNQQTMAHNAASPQQQQQQNFNPFQQQTTDFGSQNNGFVPQQQFQPQHQTGFGIQQFAPQQQQQFPSQSQQVQQNGFGGFSQQISPPTLQTQFTGAGFGGYGPQPQQPSQIQQQQGNYAAFGSSMQQQIPQQSGQLQPQPTSSNPFRQSTISSSIPQDASGFAQAHLPASQTGKNPFSHNSSPVVNQQSQQLIPQRTGTNPFAQPSSAPNLSAQLQPLQPNPTGSTNPFRQSQFVDHQTGQGWQNSQGTMGGLEQLPTMPVFPRPGQSTQQQNPWV